MLTRRQKALVTVLVVVVMLAIMACNSTLCQDSQNLNDWLGGIATQEPCW